LVYLITIIISYAVPLTEELHFVEGSNTGM